MNFWTGHLKQQDPHSFSACLGSFWLRPGQDLALHLTAQVANCPLPVAAAAAAIADATADWTADDAAAAAATAAGGVGGSAAVQDSVGAGWSCPAVAAGPALPAWLPWRPAYAPWKLALLCPPCTAHGALKPYVCMLLANPAQGLTLNVLNTFAAAQHATHQSFDAAHDIAEIPDLGAAAPEGCSIPAFGVKYRSQ